MRAILFSLLVPIILAAAAGVVGVLAGRTLADAPGEYDRGVNDGERLGRAQARAAFKPGNRDYDEAVNSAREAAYEDGRREGATVGAERGRRKGLQSAFAGFDWDVGRWYLVNIAPDGTEVRIGSRVRLQRGQWYAACEKPSGLCRRSSETTRRTASNSANSSSTETCTRRSAVTSPNAGTEPKPVRRTSKAACTSSVRKRDGRP